MEGSDNYVAAQNFVSKANQEKAADHLKKAQQACDKKNWDACIKYAKKVDTGNENEFKKQAQGLLKTAHIVSWNDQMGKRGKWYNLEGDSFKTQFRIIRAKTLQKYVNPKQGGWFDKKILKPKEGKRWVIIECDEVNRSNEIAGASKHGGIFGYDSYSLRDHFGGEHKRVTTFLSLSLPNYYHQKWADGRGFLNDYEIRTGQQWKFTLFFEVPDDVSNSALYLQTPPLKDGKQHMLIPVF